MKALLAGLLLAGCGGAVEGPSPGAVAADGFEGSACETEGAQVCRARLSFECARWFVLNSDLHLSTRPGALAWVGNGACH